MREVEPVPTLEKNHSRDDPIPRHMCQREQSQISERARAIPDSLFFSQKGFSGMRKRARDRAERAFSNKREGKHIKGLIKSTTQFDQIYHTT